MTPLEELTKTQQHLDTLYTIFRLYPKLCGEETSVSYSYYAPFPTFYLKDAVLAGDVLGKDGWVREIGNSGFNWTRSILGVKFVIRDAEEFSASPVSPKSFPLELQEASPSAAVPVE